MWTYQAPLRDMFFTIEEWLAAHADWSGIRAFCELDASTVRQVAEAAGRFSSEILAPINASGDLEGCHYDDGKVTTPHMYREAYRAYAEAGWPALSCHPDCNGQGLPTLLNAVLFEMLAAANHAWTMYPGLAYGAYECIRAHGSPWLKNRYLPKLVSGEWLATMCLSEAQAGSDLGLIRTRAELDEAGGDECRYLVTGKKMFISGGEHDLTDNIIHLVLARLPDAPAGTKGLSLFLVPKRIEHDGRYKDNRVNCDGIETKMGIKGSATCVMSFDHATGWMIGDPQRGLPAMFVMMNAARLHVALQGLGHTEAAYQIALEYSRDRVQMRAPGREVACAPGRREVADPIIMHPAIRHTLLRLRAYVQGERCIGYWIAHLLDLAEHNPAVGVRALSARLASLMTPIAKSFFTETGFKMASAALQVLGGHGYLQDHAIEQTLRDSRVTMVYEGTNELQANDLLVRMVIGDDGKVLRALLNVVEVEARACVSMQSCLDFGLKLQQSAMALANATMAIIADAAGDPELPYRVAQDYLSLVGIVLLAYSWAKSARVSQKHASTDSFYRDKLVTAQFFFDFMLPEVDYRVTLLEAGRKPLPDL